MNIVITGAGIVSAIGLNQAEVLESLQQERSGIGPMTHLPSQHRELPVGEVKLSNAEMQQMLHLDPSREMSRTTLMGILSVRQAIDDAFKEQRSHGKDISETLAGRRIVLVSGTTVGGVITTAVVARTT